ncbi:MAG: alanine--tRNA ligase [Candidatus Izemoplasmatales bacterium]|nr:alanine--tRNA ligase [Candidatus Izemoplasmatales bacterium]
MKYLTGNQIRQMWLDFFKEKGHSVEKGASLVPNDDPTLLWMNAGVAALKKYFDGSIVPKNPRIVNAQKCIRTNDIDNVGKTARHHTFFEMLGNFSIGDYFRKDAVYWAYELLTDPKWFGFDKDLLYMTVYPTDEDTKQYWMDCGVNKSHIIPTEENNFWEIGEGPCGPCTEIFFDRGEKYGDFTSDAIRDDIDNDRFIEIWNVVFSQFNAKPGLSREDYPELPSKNIDTGCGLERLASVIQKTKTNFETDLFMPVIHKIEEISNVKYTGQMAFKVIADHIRTVSFAVADGAMLSNEGRGYVLRRLLRRAVKYGKKLGIERPFLDELVDEVVLMMSEYYPYLLEKKEIIKKIISTEEKKFLETLSVGEKRFESMISETTSKVVSGENAFLLYDTFGFPVELTMEYAEELGYTVDLKGFQEEMEKQKDRARNARKEIQSMKSQNEAFLDFHDKSTFVGYETLLIETRIIKIFEEGLVLDKTPFYATSGGQEADTGMIYNSIFSVKVTDVSKLPNGQFLHTYVVLEGSPVEGQLVNAKVDEQKRKLTTYNHSATHLLFKTLRDVLGPHVSQQGSQVNSESLRFDFNHFEPITDEQILLIEQKVNHMLKDSVETQTDILTVDDAIAKGAIAEFGEKYDDYVRVVNLKFTLDLCGGTHVSNLHDIEKFAVRSISSIGSGIFRIEGLTNINVDHINDSLKGLNNDIENLFKKAEGLLEEAKTENFNLLFDFSHNKTMLGSYQDVMNKRVELQELQARVKELEKEYSKRKEERALGQTDIFYNQIEGNHLVAKAINMDIQTLKQFVDNMMVKLGSGTVFMASITDDKVIFIAKTNVAEVHAGALVKLAATICGGNGGGRNDFAQAGGKDITKVDEALQKVKEVLK